MPCFRPLLGWYSKKRNEETGKRSIVFKRHEGYDDRPISIPCGKCIGCKLEYSRQWAMKMTHEAQMSDENCFLTLTYEDEYLPHLRCIRGKCPHYIRNKCRGEIGTLCKRDYQLFMKRLRKYVKKQYPDGHKIKYFQCGEYGPTSNRPHYHAIIFNLDFEDKKPCLELQETGHYVSPTLEKLWPYGFSSIGKVTFDSCAYVAGYCIKDSFSQELEEMYSDNIYQGREKPYVTMSKKDPIGKSWYEKFKDTDVYAHDNVIIRDGIRCRPPKSYDRLLELDNPEKISILKGKRREQAKKNLGNSGHRLFQRGRVAFLKARQKQRSKI